MHQLSPRPLLSALVALHLIVLHRSDGRSVWISADEVTSLRAPAGQLGHLTPHGHCIVYLADGKFVAVQEPCEEVKRLLEAPP